MSPSTRKEYVLRELPRERRCGYCDEPMAAGELYLAMIHRGRARRWVCSDNCRLEWDAEQWDYLPPAAKLVKGGHQ